MHVPLALLCAAVALSACRSKSPPDPAPAPAASPGKAAPESAPAVKIPDRSKGFVPSTAAERLAAIGPMDTLSPQLRKVFEPTEAHFEPLGEQPSGDWLAEHIELGQTAVQFVMGSRNEPGDEGRGTIYLLPVGDFPEDSAPPVDALVEHTQAFYGLPVKILPRVDASVLGAKKRRNPYSGTPQLLSTDILEALTKRLPADAYCLIAITMWDLYPQESWNFVFGQASLVERVGVFSFARNDPAFFGEERPPDYRVTILRRSVGTMAHEIAHMFGLHHCIYFNCLVAGSNHQEESDRRWGHLCPVCLRKLHLSLTFDPLERYRRLVAFYDKHQLKAEAEWIRKRLAYLEAK